MHISGKTGLVLSGGGARGIAHIGVLQALDELDIHPAVISGSSAGAIAAAYYASGLSPREMMDIISDTGFLRLFRPSLLGAGFINADRIYETHKKHLKARFEELAIPAYICATNINEGKSVYFNSGDLPQAVNASMSMPVIFKPIEIDGYQYLDGGIMNNFPVEPLLEHEDCDFIIGVDVNAIPYKEDVSSKLNLMERVFFMSINSHADARKEAVDVLISPKDIERFGFFDVNNAKSMYQLGYEATMEALGQRSEVKGLDV
ncbi:MAG: patatin-like phospholipase family protein [Bacteroidia bacterium]